MTQPLQITRTSSTTHGSYEIELEGIGRKAELTWRARGDDRIADHSFTPPEARGRGIALQLVEAMVADARAEGFRIVPMCPYVATQFRRHPEWADVRSDGS